MLPNANIGVEAPNVASWQHLGFRGAAGQDHVGVLAALGAGDHGEAGVHRSSGPAGLLGPLGCRFGGRFGFGRQ
jgi:hypothetical protein